jgi:hypothetical protein
MLTGAEKLQPRLHEVIGGTKTKIYWTVKLGVIEVGNQAKPLKYSEKKLYFVPI